MTDTIELPILSELIQGGIEYGSNLLVEFEPDSLWYETSFAIAANALKSGRKVEYHAFVRAPKEVKAQLSRLGLDVDNYLRAGLLRIVDSHTPQIGLGIPEGSTGITYNPSLKLSDWSISTAKRMKAGEASRGSLHIDDNASVLLQYNDEKAFTDVWRTRNLPQTRVWEGLYLYALVIGVGSSPFQKQLESLSDGIIDFKSEERGGQLAHYVRMRTMRGKSFDSRWRRLQLFANGEVRLAD